MRSSSVILSDCASIAYSFRSGRRPICYSSRQRLSFPMTTTFSRPSTLPTARRNLGAEAPKLHDEVGAQVAIPALRLGAAKSSDSSSVVPAELYELIRVLATKVGLGWGIGTGSA